MDEIQKFSYYLLSEMKGKKRVRGKRTTQLHIELLKRLLKEVPDLSPDKILFYLMSLSDKGRKGTYLNDYIDMLHLYGRFKGVTIYEDLKYFPEEHFEKATMSDKEIEDFLSLPVRTVTRPDSKTGKPITYSLGKKDHDIKTLFWKCMAYTGARPGEIAHLTIDTVDFGRQVFMLDGKTGKRIVPIADHLVEELKEHIKSLTTEFLFPAKSGGTSRQGGVINDVTWGYDFHKRLKQLGIKRKNLTPYSLRHSMITRLLNEDVNLYKVQNLVGHKQGSPVTSQYYHLSTKALFQTISKDTLSVNKMPYNERFVQFRDNVRQLLKQFSKDVVEEKKMLRDLVDIT